MHDLCVYVCVCVLMHARAFVCACAYLHKFLLLCLSFLVARRVAPPPVAPATTPQERGVALRVSGGLSSCTVSICVAASALSRLLQ